MYNKIFHNFIKRYLKVPEIKVNISDNGQDISINGKQLSPDQVSGLVQEAVVFKGSPLLQGIMDSMRVQATEDLIINNKTEEDMYFPRATLYVIDTIEKQLNIIINRNLTSENNNTRLEIDER
jgi:hypothetical protein